MNIFGLHITTQKSYDKLIAEMRAKLEEQEEVLEAAFEVFPLVIGQTVYDIALKNESGRYTKLDPSFERSTITPVEVTEKNYFSLVNRYKRNDVFFTHEAAEEYLRNICK